MPASSEQKLVLAKALEEGGEEGGNEALHEMCKGFTVYVLATYWNPDLDDKKPLAQEDEPNDLVKVGETECHTPDERLNAYKKSPLPVRLVATMYPMHDWFVHQVMGEKEKRWQQAFDLGLPHHTEWYRGGSEQFAISQIALCLDWVKVEALDQTTGAWENISEAHRRAKKAA